MQRLPLACVVLALLAGVTPTAGQVLDRPGAAPRAGGEIHGRVLAADTGEPIAGASVAVWSPVDSAIVTGAIAGGDGAFRIEGVPPGTYYAHATSIGYAPRRSENFTLGPRSPRVDLGAMRLARSDVEAEEIQVTVERPAITLEPDRNTYVAQDIAPSAATASEVLESVPSVFVDTDGQVSLRGNESVAVHINGRPSPVRGDQLGSYLQQLPAHAIDRIEVIPTPSARYDPEGMAGIINIVMKRNAEPGTSGGITLGAATSERYTLGGNLGHQRGPLSLLTTYGYTRMERNIVGINDREVLEDGATVSLTEQDMIGEDAREGHNLSTTLELRLGERDVLTNALVLNRRTSTDEAFNVYSELDADGSLLDRYARPSQEDEESFVFDYTLGFRRTWEPRVHELTTEIRFNREVEDEHELRWRQPVEDPGSRIDIESADTDALERELDIEANYVRALGESTKLEAGYDGNARWLDEEYLELEDSLGTGAWVPSDLSNAFTFDEQVHAAYGVMSRGLGGFELQAGLRAELASQEFALADERFPHDYASLFPSGIVVWNATEADQLKLSYSRRVRRPRTRQLNPFPRFDDVQNVFIGNPALDPEYTDAFELGWTRTGEIGSLQITPFYRRTTDVIRHVIDTDDVVDGRPVTSIRFENLATSDSWGADVNASLELGEWFDGFTSFNLFKLVTDGGSTSSLSTDAVTWSTRVNGTVRLTPTLSLQAMTLYRAPREIEGGGKYSSFSLTSLTLQQKLWDERASLSLRVFDPFDRMAFRAVIDDENLIQITERVPDARSLQLTFQYTFGRPPRSRPSQPQDDPEAEGIFP